MLEAGILLEDEPVELLEGDLVVMSPQSPPHAATTERIARCLESAYGQGFHARRHSPLVAANDSLPEPDVALCQGGVERFEQQHPRGDETLLVAEIAHTSRRIDRRKAAIYARAGVPTYWLVDLVARRLEVRSQPQSDGEYSLIRLLEPGAEVELPVIGKAIPVADFLR